MQQCVVIGRDNVDILPGMVMNQSYGIFTYLIFVGKIVLSVKCDHMIVYYCCALLKEF